jgi:hypothetical protein
VVGDIETGLFHRSLMRVALCSERDFRVRDHGPVRRAPSIMIHCRDAGRKLDLYQLSAICLGVAAHLVIVVFVAVLKGLIVLRTLACGT